MAESLIEWSYLYLNVNSNASPTEGFDLAPSQAAQIMKKFVTQCLHCTNDSWHFVFLFLHADEEAAWLSSRVACIFQRCRESRRVEAQMCVCGGDPFDYGTESIHVVCSAWLMTPSVSITANIWLQLRPWNPSALWGWHRDKSSLRSQSAIWN